MSTALAVAALTSRRSKRGKRERSAGRSGTDLKEVKWKGKREWRGPLRRFYFLLP